MWQRFATSPRNPSYTVGHLALKVPQNRHSWYSLGIQDSQTRPRGRTSCVRISNIFPEFLPLDTFPNYPTVCHVKLCDCQSTFTQTSDLSVLDGEHITCATLHTTEHSLWALPWVWVSMYSTLNSVTIVTRLRTGRSGVRNQVGTINCCLLHNVYTGPGVHPS
jgi:hypothetical protein